MAETVTIKIPPTIVVRDFAAKLGLPVTAVAAELMKNGVMASLNQEIDYDTAQIIAEDLGKKVAPQSADDASTETAGPAIAEFLKEKTGAKLIARPPVVVVMGHVDHGKTSLLDAIRQTKVTEGEAGGITQHIGAYQVTEKDRLITFVDTPGHAAFTQMRARGAKVADVAIVVVAADDGIKPQSVETLKIVHQAGIPYIVAITKIDKDGAQPDKVKKQLADESVGIEEFGGQTPVVLVSAKTKEGISDLLESVLLVADIHPEALMVDPDRQAVGTIIESHVDPQQGPVASVLVHTGTLKVGDEVVVGQVWGKIRSLKNDLGELVKAAPPSLPVQILGLKAAPQVGDILRVAPDEIKELKKKTKSHHIAHHLQTVVGQRPVVMQRKGQAETSDGKPKVKKHFIILKTDTLGSAEAILESMKKIQHPEVAAEIIQRGLGIIAETDVLRADAAGATVYGFHVPVSPKAEQLAASKEVSIRAFKVIYDLLDDVKRELEKLLPPIEEIREVGRLKVLAIFRNENTFQVVGGKVSQGSITLGTAVQIWRGGQQVSTGKITQLQQDKKNTPEVSEGFECGMKVEGQPIMKVGDELVAIAIERRERKLDEVS